MHDKVKEDSVMLNYIETKENVADMMTKPLPRVTFEYLKQKLGMVELTSRESVNMDTE